MMYVTTNNMAAFFMLDYSSSERVDAGTIVMRLGPDPEEQYSKTHSCILHNGAIKTVKIVTSRKSSYEPP